MRPFVLLALALSCFVAGFAACSSGPKQGEEGGACYGNGTCNAGLECLSQLCVNPGVDGGGDAAPDVGNDVVTSDASGEAGDAGDGAASCGNGTEPCCPANTCNDGGCCVDGTCVAATTACPHAFGTCTAGACGTCGGTGESCCGTGDAGQCTAPQLTCGSSGCSECGGVAQPCCALDSCLSPHTCTNGTCI